MVSGKRSNKAAAAGPSARGGTDADGRGRRQTGDTGRRSVRQSGAGAVKRPSKGGEPGGERKRLEVDGPES